MFIINCIIATIMLSISNDMNLYKKNIDCKHVVKHDIESGKSKELPLFIE